MKVLIVEDEPMARRTLAGILDRLYPEIEIAGETASVRDTLHWLKYSGIRPDIIFMDVELSDGNCFDIFRQTEIRSQVIMTTAYDSYAVKAFEVESVDYLLKPIEAGDLKRAVQRCLSRAGSESPVRHFKERFLVRINDTIVPVKTSDIAWFYSEDKTTYLYTKDGKKYIVDFSLEIVSELLQPEAFSRISRNCIIALSSIERVSKIGSRLKLETTPKTSLDMIVSRSRTDDFLVWLEGK